MSENDAAINQRRVKRDRGSERHLQGAIDVNTIELTHLFCRVSIFNEISMILSGQL